MFPNRQSNRLIMLEDPHYVVSLNQTIDDSKKQNNILKKFFIIIYCFNGQHFFHFIKIIFAFSKKKKIVYDN
jgi:hypothetical protein